MSEFNTGLPSIRQVQNLIKDKKQVELKVMTGDMLTGKLLWQDHNCLCLLTANGQSTLVWYQSLVYIRAKS